MGVYCEKPPGCHRSTELLWFAFSLEATSLTERPVPDSVETTGADLDARYGRTPASANRTRVIVAISALAFAVVFVLWLVWAGLLGSPAQFQATDTAHSIIGDSAVDVTWQFTVEPGTDARCAVQALNETFAIVGWKIVDVPASSIRTRDLTERVLTTEPAVTGLIYRCWLT
ncbi:MAG: DUF4307 domain-containing protein [Salinibacterium sp.]|nr:DUF4307 domain-containing protein [Salinibacterium sp.]